MNRFAIALLLLASSSIARADDTSSTSPAARAKIVSERTEGAIAGLIEAEAKQAERLKQFKQAIVDPKARGTTMPADAKDKIRVTSKEAKKAEIEVAEKNLAETRAKLKELKAGERFAYGTLSLPPKLDDFGAVGSVKVRQVLGQDSLIVEAYYLVSGYKVVRNTPIPTQEPRSVTLMVRNVSTRGVTDDSGVQLPGVFEVTDTETYETVDGGTKTVFVIEPLKTEPIERALRSVD